MAFYNCTPQTSAFTLGLAASMEEQYAADRENFNPDTINAVKTSLMGPLSGIGDSFFQGTIRIIAFGLGIQLAQQGSILGPILAMLISFVPSFVVTWLCAKIGYTTGSKYLTNLQGGMMDKMMYVCGIVGLMVIGAMVASMVGLTTPIAFESTGLVLQDIIDTILPCAIDLAVVMGMYTLIKKKVSTGWLLLTCIVGGIVANAPWHLDLTGLSVNIIFPSVPYKPSVIESEKRRKTMYNIDMNNVKNIVADIVPVTP